MRLRQASIIFVQLVFLWLINEVGYYIVETLGLPLPGNVLGMLILFGLLMSGIVSLSWVEQASGLLIKHLAFFFIPIAVGLMNFGGLFIQNGVALLVAITLSAAFGIFVTGFSSQALSRKKEGGEKQHDRDIA